MIKETTTVLEAVKKYAGVTAVFSKYRLDCPTCRGAGQDTIEKVALNNGMDLKKLLAELNEAAKG
ncbi:MAG TPA: DUF1858 domain-containing protein [Spirochaetes bacterium]|nr:DUF1858 domain-containing protein [Spirochaetota bacterium]